MASTELWSVASRTLTTASTPKVSTRCSAAGAGVIQTRSKWRCSPGKPRRYLVDPSRPPHSVRSQGEDIILWLRFAESRGHHAQATPKGASSSLSPPGARRVGLFTPYFQKGGTILSQELKADVSFKKLVVTRSLRLIDYTRTSRTSRNVEPAVYTRTQLARIIHKRTHLRIIRTAAARVYVCIRARCVYRTPSTRINASHLCDTHPGAYTHPLCGIHHATNRSRTHPGA